MYALAYCWVVTTLAPFSRFENVFLIHVILRPPYANAVAGGVTPSKLSQTCPQSKLVGTHTTLPSIGKPAIIAISYRVIDISQVDRWNVWISNRHRSTKEVIRPQSISICGRRVTRYSLHWCKYGVIRSPNCGRGANNGVALVRWKPEIFFFKKKYTMLYCYCLKYFHVNWIIVDIIRTLINLDLATYIAFHCVIRDVILLLLHFKYILQ